MSEISQVGLIQAIATHLEKFQRNVNQRQLNAIITAADLIVREFAIPHKQTSDSMGLDNWLLSDETGTSSRYMATFLSGRECRSRMPGGRHWPDPYPHDPSDFARCVGLLKAVPELREKISELTKPEHGPVWNRIVEEWDVLEALYNEELPTGKAPRLYAKLQEYQSLSGSTVGEKK